MKNEGYLMVDHRASPGITEDQARKIGYHPSQVKEGALFEAAIYGCPHCGTQVIRNPLRTRERGFCFKCSENICDACEAATRSPDYVHMTIRQIVDLVSSGKFIMSGSMSLPKLTPTE